MDEVLGAILAGNLIRAVQQRGLPWRRAHGPRKEVLETESEHLLAYAKRTGDNLILAVVNLDPFEAREGLAIVPAALGVPPAFPARDVLRDATYTWHIGRNYVRLDPGQSHVLRVGG